MLGNQRLPRGLRLPDLPRFRYSLAASAARVGSIGAALFLGSAHIWLASGGDGVRRYVNIYAGSGLSQISPAINPANRQGMLFLKGASTRDEAIPLAADAFTTAMDF